MQHPGKHRIRIIFAILLAPVLALPMVSVALAHPDHGGGGREEFPGEGVVSGEKQHGGQTGHLPAISESVRVVGQTQVSNPSGAASSRGRVADVAAYGNHAYLTSFRSDNCLGGGAWVVDISDPTAPREVAFLPTTAGSYAGEGSQVITPAYGPFAGRQLFLHQNETCNDGLADSPTNRGGINIWDVTQPQSAQLLVKHAGDTDGVRPHANTVHSVFAWSSHLDQKLYAVLIDNDESADVDILDITDPTQPTMVNDTLDLVTLFGVDQSTPPTLTSVFNHDAMVYRMGERYVMNVNYWDGGYVLLDVTDPTPGNVTLIAETDFAQLDEERLGRGHEIAPEGNAHQSEFSPDFRHLIGTDEDFGPYRVVATITGGPHAGTAFTATSANLTPAVDESTSIVGTPRFVGLACSGDPIGAGDGGIALVERGVCSFQEKLDSIRAAGYSAGLVFNSVRADCQSRVTMAASGDIPFLFVQRLTGLQILGLTGISDPCTTASPAAGSPANGVSIRSVFDGWGYVRLFRTTVPREPGTAGSVAQIGTYAIAESQDPAFARGFGDLSVHEVAMDPRPGTNLAYLSYYSGGFRVLEYSKSGLREVGAFIDSGGSNFWGVEVHKHPNGQQYVLASDRDHGLYLFQYTGQIAGGNRGPVRP